MEHYKQALGRPGAPTALVNYYRCNSMASVVVDPPDPELEA